MDHGLLSVTRGTFTLFVGSLAFIVATFVWRVVLVRTLSQNEWSVFSLGLAYAALFVTLGDLGLGSTVGRSLPHAEKDDERRGIIRVALLLRGAGAAVSVLVMFALAGPLASRLGQPGFALAFEIFAVSVGFTVMAGFLASIFRAYEDVRPNAYFIQILNPVLFLVFLGGMMSIPSTQLSLITALVAYLLASALTLLATIAYTIRHLPRLLPPGPHRRDMLRPTLAIAAPLFVVSVMFYLSGSADTLVLGAYDSVIVGTYTASLSMARLLTVGIGALQFIFLPVAARLHRDRDIESIGVLYVTTTKWTLLASLPLFLVFVLLPSPSLQLVYGSGYASVTLQLQLLTVGAFLSTLIGPAASAQIALGHQWLLLVNAVVSALTDIGLSFWLVPRFGMNGAAIAWASSTALFPALSLTEIATMSGIHPFRREVWAPLVGTIVPASLILYAVPSSAPLWTPVVLAIACLVLFIVMVIVTHSVSEGDKRLLYAIESMIGRQLRFVRHLGAHGVPSRSTSLDKKP